MLDYCCLLPCDVPCLFLPHDLARDSRQCPVHVVNLSTRLRELQNRLAVTSCRGRGLALVDDEAAAYHDRQRK